MISAAESAGVKLMVGHVLRLYPSFWKVKQIISSGELGKPFAISFSRTGYGTHFFTDWRCKIKTSGGIIFEVNAHELDFMRHIMGEASEAYAQMGNFRTPQVEYEDLSFVVVKFQNGGIGTLQSSIADSLGEYRNSIFCSEGTLANGGFGGQIRYSRFEGEAVTIEIGEIEKPEPYLDELTSFISSIVSGSEMVFDGRDGRAAVELAVAAYRSAETGTPVKLPLH